MVFVREGGAPRSFKTKDLEADKSLSPLELKGILAFEALIEKIGKKQDRLLFFYCDPEKERPIQGQNFLEFMSVPI